LPRHKDSGTDIALEQIEFGFFPGRSAIRERWSKRTA